MRKGNQRWCCFCKTSTCTSKGQVSEGNSRGYCFSKISTCSSKGYVEKKNEKRPETPKGSAKRRSNTDKARLLLKKEKLTGQNYILLMDTFSLSTQTHTKLGRTTSNFALLIFELYSLKVYVYPMHSRKQILQRLEQFYDEVQKKKISSCKWTMNFYR